MEDNHIYQYSLLNALMDGVSEDGITATKLATKGNQGLGTFSRMNGELLFLDGIVYQLQAEGNVREAGPDDQIPFAVSTNFVPQQTKSVQLKDKNDVDALLDEFNNHSKNLFMTYRLNGTFDYLKCRTVRGQEYKGQPLSELGKKQSVETYEKVEGTIIGFRTPKNWQGFGVAGEHLHFINSARTAGGHVLEAQAKEVEMQMALASNVHIELPTSDDFNEAKLVTDDEGGEGCGGVRRRKRNGCVNDSAHSILHVLGPCALVQQTLSILLLPRPEGYIDVRYVHPTPPNA